MSTQYTDEEVAIYTILNGQKAAGTYLQLTDEVLQSSLSRMLELEEGLPFFTKIRETLLQFQKYIDVEDLSERFELSNKVLGLLAIRLEKDQKGNIEINPVKRKREGEIEFLELNLNFKKLKSNIEGSQLYQNEDILLPPDPISNEEIMGQQEESQQSNGGQKKRGKRSKLQVDQNMIYALKMVQEDTLKVKDLADRYGVSPACIYQIMKTHGYSVPNKGRGRKTKNEEELQLMALQNMQAGGMFNDNQFRQLPQNNLPNQQVQLMGCGSQGELINHESMKNEEAM